MTISPSKVVCSICTVGTPFIINDNLKDSTFSVGTTGFLGYILGPDHNNPNIVFQNTLITKRGKKGKRRLENGILLNPIYKFPGLPIEDIIPKMPERKGFVDIDINDFETVGLINRCGDDFVAWLLARSNFAAELDEKSNFPQGHKIAQVLSTSNRQVYVWPKEGKLYTFRATAETMYNGGHEYQLAEEFLSINGKRLLLSELKQIEMLLTIPRLEYQRKVCNVLIDALEFIHATIADKAIKDKDNIVSMINSTRDQNIKTRTAVETTIDTRLSQIVAHRKLINVDF